MNHEGFEFDLITQRFIENRWETEIGKKVSERLIDGLKNGVETRRILDKYVLEHPDNQDPYAHPYYPTVEMTENSFWVLTQDDLRGINISNEEFQNSSFFAKKDLNYARFYNCNFNGANLERTSLTHVKFDKCNLEGACFAASGGYEIGFVDCNLINVCFWETELREADFSGSNLSGAYFESATLTNISLNYLSIFDRKLNTIRETRNMPENQKPEIFKAFRVAYGKAELWTLADQYLYLEKLSNRKNIIWQKFMSNKNINTFWDWLIDWSWGVSTGYGIKPGRLLIIGSLVAVFFSIVYYFCGNPGSNSSFSSSLYYSLTTFATLGYGDLFYTEAHWIMRLVSTFEALSGAVIIAAFVAVMARKVIRH